MIKTAHRILASAVMIVFVNFMFSNIIFTHIHQDSDGRAIAHSHPYLPSSGHSHSAGSLSAIANFNLSASSAEATENVTVACPHVLSTDIFSCLRLHVSCRHTAAQMLRGPPFWCK